MEDQDTKITIYRGHAAEDLAVGSTTLKVVVPQLTPSITGTFAAGTSTGNVSYTDLTGATHTASVKTANHLIAEWEGESNVAYAPLIKAGEQVEIRQYGDTPKYYWRPYGRDHTIRRLDKFRVFVTNTPSSKIGPVDPDDTNTYMFELNSLDGSVTVKTSKSNSEKFAYTIKIDTKNSTVLITDDADQIEGTKTPNRIFMDSKVPQIQINNSKGTVLSLLDQDFILAAPRDGYIKAVRQLVLQTDALTLDVVGSSGGPGVIYTRAKAMGYDVDSSYVVNAPQVGLNGDMKASGHVVLGPTRVASLSDGPVGDAYAAATTNVGSGTGTVPNVPSDTNTGGDGERYAAAQQQLEEMAQVATTWFSAIQNKIGVPNTDQTLIQLAADSTMRNIKGT